MMRDGLQKVLVFVLSLALAASVPALSHARMTSSGAAASHEVHHVQNYADLCIEAGDSDCSREPEETHHQNDVLCQKCCAACLGASLIPSAPAAVQMLSGPTDLVASNADTLVACEVPTEPGIPKPL
jgi:hypothetical protein